MDVTYLSEPGIYLFNKDNLKMTRISSSFGFFQSFGGCREKK